jgi:ABC-2 type transport system permease protein
VLTVALALAVATPWLRARGIDVDLGASSTLRIIVGGIIASGIWGVIGIGVGALLRNQVAAVVGIVLYRFLIEGILSAIPKVKSAYPYLPGGATNSLLTTNDPNVNDGSLHLLSPWVGGALLLAYGLVFAIVGTMLTVRRDVT